MSNDTFNPILPHGHGKKASRHESTPAPADAKRAPWGPWRALIGTIVSFLGAQIVVGELISAYANAHHWSSAHTNDVLTNSVPAQFWYILIVETITLGVLWGFVAKFGWSRVRQALGLGRPHWKDLLYAALGVLVYFGVYSAVLSLSGLFIHVNVGQQQDIGFQTASASHSNLILAFISLAVLPPFAEEIIFRGFLFRGLRTKMPLLIAMLVTSVAFAYPHSLESSDGSVLWIAAIDTFSLSLVLCYLREKTGRLYAGIGVHAIKNTIAFVSLFLLHVH